MVVMVVHVRSQLKPRTAHSRGQNFIVVKSSVPDVRFLVMPRCFSYGFYIVNYLCTRFVNTGTNEHLGNVHIPDMILDLEEHG